jgi:ubiquinone/menaquinone biosynthesis C-methylase UbiE
MFRLFIEAYLGGTGSISAHLLKGKKTLDIGCGTGDFLRYDTKNFVGVDVNAEAIAIAKSRGLNVVKGNATKLPFGNNHFEGVHCRQVIEHLGPNEAYNMLKEVHRVLKPGGLAILATEMPTNVFWNTFSHIRPYPPAAIRKITGKAGQETFEKIEGLKEIGVYYTGPTFNSKWLTILSNLFANYLWINRRNYLMLLTKE